MQRTRYEQIGDVKIAVTALQRQFSHLEREYISIYNLRTLSSARQNVSNAKRTIMRKICEFLSMNSVYDILIDNIAQVKTNLYWNICAIDGERNFIHKLPMVCSRIDLIDKARDKCILSVALFPFMREIISCAEGLGCNIEVNREDCGRRYVSKENADDYLVATNCTADDNSVNLHNNTMAIAYTACGYFTKFTIQDAPNDIQHIAKLFMEESGGSCKIHENILTGSRAT